MVTSVLALRVESPLQKAFEWRSQGNQRTLYSVSWRMNGNFDAAWNVWGKSGVWGAVALNQLTSAAGLEVRGQDHRFMERKVLKKRSEF